jgi:alanine racemase
MRASTTFLLPDDWPLMTAILDIDLNAIAANWRSLAARHPGATAGVVKADAYGLGATYVAPNLFAAGCRHFFVAHLAEAAAIRPLVPGAMLAVLNGLLAEEIREYSGQDITPVLGSLAEIALWRDEAARLGRVLPALLHFDTGISRLGIPHAEFAVLRDDASLLDGIAVQFLMTHLVSAELPDDEINQRQLARFATVRAAFPNVPASIANSSGMFLGPEFGLNLTRPGAALYGINPKPGTKNPMHPAVRLRARIMQVQHIEPGETVGYNGIWKAQRPSRIAVLSVGYADGYLRSLSNTATAMFNGCRIQLVGRVSMDLTTFDITDTPATVGDSLDLISPTHDADALAKQAGTNGYEILTSLGRRYQRRYIGVQ